DYYCLSFDSGLNAYMF
nr:immunoglobulin light chain junction region [Macaca mulatta]